MAALNRPGQSVSQTHPSHARTTLGRDRKDQLSLFTPLLNLPTLNLPSRMLDGEASIPPPLPAFHRCRRPTLRARLPWHPPSSRIELVEQPILLFP